jgi:hypothetical protein
VHNKVVSSGYHNYDGCRIPVKSGINVDFFRKNLSDYDDRIICELLEFGAPIINQIISIAFTKFWTFFYKIISLFLLTIFYQIILFSTNNLNI